MTKAPEFSCPYSPDPDNPKCVPGEHCFCATEFENIANKLGSVTKKRTDSDLQTPSGPWIKRRIWDDAFLEYMQKPDCAQPRLRSRLMGVIDRLKQKSGHLI